MKNKKNERGVNNGVVKSNLVKKITLEVLNEKHNALARYIGIPCVIEPTDVFNGAVMADASVVQSNEYACYRVDLKPFKGQFDKIRFRATTDGKDVVFGMLIDNDGNLESMAKADEPGEATILMPLSAKSKMLFATIPLKNGKPAWKNITIELLTKGGILAEVNDALNTLLGKIQALEKRVEENFSNRPAEVNICVG